MKIHQISVEEALNNLHTGEGGLTSNEATNRLKEFGQNHLREERRKPLVIGLLKEFTHFFSIVLWLAAGLAFVLERSTPGQGMARLGYVIVAVIVISGLFSFWQEFRVEKALAALRRLLPHQVQVIRGGKVFKLDTDQLVPGDVLLLKEGSSVPADCRLIEAFAVKVNMAILTGESIPQPRDASPSNEENLLQSGNILLAGTSIVAGRGKAVVFATGMQTEFGRIAHLTQASGDAASPLHKEIAYLSRMIIALAVAIGMVFFTIGWLIGFPLWEDLTFAIGLIVAMVPEGLLPTLTLSLILATQRMAKRNVLIRHLPAVEALGSATVICTDKTGTLTQNRMTVGTLSLGVSDHLIPIEAAKDSAPLFFAISFSLLGCAMTL